MRKILRSADKPSADDKNMRPQAVPLRKRIRPRFIDLFAGIGGFRVALESQGFEAVFACEWDGMAQKTYAANFGETPAGDIRSLKPEEIPSFDILCAGFPCQPFSIAGVSKKNALGRPHGFADETQGTLFFEILRLLAARKPEGFLLENVKNLASHDGGRTFQVILRKLESAGYHLKTSVLNASSVLPQNRARVYIVGFRNRNVLNAFQFPVLANRNPCLSDILEKRVPEKYVLSNHLWNYLQEYKRKHELAGHGFGFGLADRKGITRTLSARYYKDGSEILIPVRGKNPRRLTPRECARLMGFPDSFKIVVSDTQAYKQFGNSVAVPVVESIASQMKKALDHAVPDKKKATNAARKIGVSA